MACLHHFRDTQCRAFLCLGYAGSPFEGNRVCKPDAGDEKCQRTLAEEDMQGLAPTDGIQISIDGFIGMPLQRHRLYHTWLQQSRVMDFVAILPG